MIMGTPPGNANDGKLLTDDRFLRRIAYLYYEDGQTQDAIAEMEFCSRQTIGKALQKAKDRGFVRISIVPDQRVGYLRNLSRDLRLRLGLDDLVLVPGPSLSTMKNGGTDDATMTEIASTAADYLDQLLTDSDILAISGGKDIMRRVVSYLRPTKLLPNLRIIPTIGFVKPYASFGDPNLIAYDIAVAYAARSIWLPIPAFIDTQEQREQVYALPIIRDAIQLMNKATIVMTGLWAPNSAGDLVSLGVLSRQQIDTINACNPVLDINHWSFNASGECINEQLETPPYYLTGLEIPRLKEKISRGGARVILVAGANISYVPAIRAALKAGIANILVTDHVTAELLMQPEKES